MLELHLVSKEKRVLGCYILLHVQFVKVVMSEHMPYMYPYPLACKCK